MKKSFRVPLKESYLLIIIIVGILSLCMYSSFALFSLEKTTSKDIFTMKAASDIETTLKIFEYKKITVSAGDNASVMVNVNNDTGGSIYYGVFYEMLSPSIKSDDITIAKIDWSANATSGSITNGSILPVELIIINNSSSDITLNIGVAGSDSNELGLTEGKTLITETFDTGEEPSGDTGTPTTTTTDYNFDITKTNGETITLKPGTHKLEAWGASGVYSGANPTNSHPNGYGGYASGTLTLTESLNVTLYIGGSPNSNNDVNYGGWNGGGSSYKGSSYNDNGSGGGATDICLTPSSITTDSYQRYVRTSASYLSRILVAGGGGGGRSSNTISNGGYFNTTGSNTYVGSLTAAGSSSGTYQAGGFGFGASGTSSSDDHAGGGGGWYGGGSNGDSYGGGGSSFVWSSATASSVPSGYTPSTKYKMTDVVYNQGNTTMPSSTSTTGTETGHSGDGHIRITSTIKANTAPSIDTSSVTLKPEPVTNLKDIVTCNDNGSGCKIVLVKPSNTSKMKEDVTNKVLYVLEDNSGKRYKYNKEVILSSAVNAAQLINSLNDNTTGDSGSGVYKVSHDAIPASSSATGSEIKASDDYRYYGSSPNNYICLDMEGGRTCSDKHLYRIIGSIYEEKENTNRIKVIKATGLTDGNTSEFSWNYTSSGSYNNIWATVTSGNYSNSLSSGSTLMQLLNNGLWWNGASGSYYNNSTTATTVNFTNYKLSDKTKSYISTSRYYLGGYNTNPPLTNGMYGYERGTLRYNASRPLYWDGMVGLMYSSDYGYAAGNSCVTGTTLYNYNSSCYQKDWLYNSGMQWLMSPNSGDSTYAFYTVAGRVDYYTSVNGYNSVRPVFYLKSDTNIKSGDGSKTNPYLLS